MTSQFRACIIRMEQPLPEPNLAKERPMRKLIFCLCCLLWAIPVRAGDLELDLECLQEA